MNKVPTIIGVRELRDHLAQYGAMAEHEPIVVMQHQEPVAVLLGIQLYNRLVDKAGGLPKRDEE